jgi:hypothetical protein
MTLKRAEAAELVVKCLPKLGVDGSSADGVNQKDVSVNTVCRLWAGMGYIYDIKWKSHHIIVKRILPPPLNSRSFGDQRKATSYLIEANFYSNVADFLILEHQLAIPVPFLVERSDDDHVTICMSRLDGRPGGLGTDDEVHAVLRWLATLHAATWAPKIDELVSNDGCGLQPIGSYWHLDTRPDEHQSMPRRGWEGRLKRASRAIDERLKRDPMQCCIHGDAKDANIMFAKGDNNECEAMLYDFQYCGRGPPSVDLAYFICVAVGYGDNCAGMLKFYHRELTSRLGSKHMHPSFEALEESVALAFADFQRFMSGWGQWGSDLSSVVIEVLDRLDGGDDSLTEDGYREAMLREYG